MFQPTHLRSYFKAAGTTALLALTILISGCAGAAFSPETVAVNGLRNNPLPNFVLEPNSVQALQSISLPNATFVLLSYAGKTKDTGESQTCLWTYQIQRNFLGALQGGSGGGSCAVEPSDPNETPISITWGQGTVGGPVNSSYSDVSGKVFRGDVRQIRVTWSDGMVQPLSVIQKSYMSVRAGMFEMQQIDVFDPEMKLVYTFNPKADSQKKISEENQ